MNRPLSDEDIAERASIDGRVVFALAAFALGAGVVILLDRVGMAETIVGGLGPALVLIGLALVGLLLRSMRVSRFYAGGRAVQPVYAGLALACLAAALFAPFAPSAVGAASRGGLLWGFGGGLCVAALVTGPLLRKTGAFSLPDLLAARFPTLALRLAAAAVAAGVSGLVGTAGLESAVRALVITTGLSRELAAAALAGVTALIVAPGGLGGMVWAATGAAGTLIAALAFPLAALALDGAAPMLFLDRAAWVETGARMALWSDAQIEASNSPVLVLALSIGVGALAPLMSCFIACPNQRGARRAGLAAIGWAALIAALVAASMALAVVAFDATLIGAQPERLPQFIYAAGAKDLVTICGAHAADPAAAHAACLTRAGFKGVLRAQDIAASGQYMLIGLPELRGFGSAFSGLLAAGEIGAGLVLAAAGFQAMATALGHDAFYRVRDTAALTSRRLAVTRLVLVAAIGAAAALLAHVSCDPRTAIALAIAFSAAGIAPLLALALWPRASGADATVALLAGLATAEIVIMTAGGSPGIDRLAGAALLACLVSVAAGLATSLLRGPEDFTRGGAFVHGVLHGEADVLAPDKGA